MRSEAGCRARGQRPACWARASASPMGRLVLDESEAAEALKFGGVTREHLESTPPPFFDAWCRDERRAGAKRCRVRRQCRFPASVGGGGAICCLAGPAGRSSDRRFIGSAGSVESPPPVCSRNSTSVSHGSRIRTLRRRLPRSMSIFKSDRRNLGRPIRPSTLRISMQPPTERAGRTSRAGRLRPLRTRRRPFDAAAQGVPARAARGPRRFAGGRPLLRSRDTQSDVGTTISTPSETVRQSPADVAQAAFKRAQEAVRSLEEFGKLLSADAATAIRAAPLRALHAGKGTCADRFNRRERAIGDSICW